MNIALVEYGAGNLPSVERALSRLGVESRRASTPEALADCDALILPGVGHFGALMRSLGERSLVKPLREAVSRGTPLLGICLGLQAMFATSDEAPGDAGLALFPQKVSALPPIDRLPHMGWNQLRRARPSKLLEGVPQDAYFYFAHSYAALDAGEAGVAYLRSLRLVRRRARAGKRFRDAISSRKIGPGRRANPFQFCAASGRQGMSLAHRIIPCLDTDGERVVKGVNFVNLRDAGDPAALAARYNIEGADELVVLDIAASRDHRPTFLETIRRVAAELAIPLTAGGGVANVDEGRAILRAGADKLTVNTAAIRNPPLLTALAAEFGSQAVVLAIDAKRVGDRWEAFVRGGSVPTGIDAVAWARQGVDCGAGEILITSMDKDGTRSGFDCPLTAAISRAVSVPVIASGGADTPETFLEVFREGRADAALAASIFHDSIQGLGALKRYLGEHGVSVRQTG